MAIPKIDLPIYELSLKSENRNIRFRPFLVKEEKLLIIALESNELKMIVDTVKQVINNCVLDPIDVDTLPMFEVENIFLNLRARSMGEVVEVTFVCQNVVNEKKCAAEMDLQVNLLDVALEMKEIDPVIKITDKVGMKMKFPTFETSKIVGDAKGDDQLAMKIIRDCTEFIYDESSTYMTKDITEEEFYEFLDNMTQEQFAKIRNFFNAIPTIKYNGHVQCPKCKKEHDVLLEGILDFFE
jgi:hypothetical protein